jgi:hypothetical protein
MEYQYKLREISGRSVIAIKTDAVDNVSSIPDLVDAVDEISEEWMINPIEFYIVFSNKTNLWHGFNYATKTITVMKDKTWREAAINYLKTA